MTRRHLIAAALMVVTLTAASCQSARPTIEDVVAEGARQIVGEELLVLHSDTTHYGSFAKTGNPWSEYHHPDGRVMYRERSRPEPGNWSIDGDQVCYVYAWNAGDPYCYFLYAKEGRYYQVNANGDEIGLVSSYIDSIRPGDAEGYLN